MNIPAFNVIGISIRTTNENQQAAQDIGALWHRFMTEGIIENIPNKVDSTIYSIYTEYEEDYTKPYTTILGCKVSSLDNIPEGMVGKRIAAADYQQFTSKGDAVYQTWVEIWNTDLPRAYTADLEVYKSKDEVEIFIAIKPD